MKAVRAGLTPLQGERASLAATVLPGLFLLHLGLHPLSLFQAQLPLALLRFLALGCLQLRLYLLRMDEPLLYDPSLDHGDEVGKKIVVAQA